MPLDAQQVTAVGRILRDLGREGLAFYARTDYAPWQNLAVHHKAIGGEPELDALLPSKDNRSGKLDGRAIPLAPSKRAKGAAALLRVEWDYDADPWMLKYYLLLYYGSAQNRLPQLGLSFRLEQPESGGQVSTHGYWHLQLCKEVASDQATRVLACHELTPVSYPAFPLNADDAVTLTTSISIALSGRPALDAAINGLKGQGPLQRKLSEKYSHAIV